MNGAEFNGRRGLDRYRRELRFASRRPWPLPDYLRESPELLGLLTPAPAKCAGLTQTVLMSSGFYELEPHLLVVRSTAFFEAVTYVPLDLRQRLRGPTIENIESVRAFVRRYRRLLLIHWFLPERLPGPALFKRLARSISRRSDARDSLRDSSGDSSRLPRTEEGS